MTENKFGNLLTLFREKEGWSMRELALRSETTHGMISLLESGKRQPTKEMVHRLAKGFGKWQNELLEAAGYIPLQNREPKDIELIFTKDIVFRGRRLKEIEKKALIKSLEIFQELQEN